MNNSEKLELKEFLNDYVGEVIVEHGKQLTAIHGTLKNLEDGNARIEQRLTQLNGTVARNVMEIHSLQLADVQHIVDCPHKKKIDEVDKKYEALVTGMDKILLPIKFFIQFPWFAPVGIGAVVLGILVVIFELFIKK